MDEIRLLSALINMATATFKFITVIIDSRKRKKPFPPQSEKASKHHE